MKVLIKNATINSDTSPHNGQLTDILIQNGTITEIGNNIEANADKLIESEGLNVSAGWMDCFANFCDPGDEYKEDLESGAKAAAAGGFTDVMLVPNTNPVVYNKSQVEYIIQKSKHLPVTIHPIGTISKNGEGKELSEMYDMKNSGAVAFSEGIDSLQSSGLMMKALQYVLAFDGTIIQMPDDRNIGMNGMMNEGITSTRLGLPGKPAIAEEIIIARDIELAKYTNSKIHFTGISTRRSFELIKKAKEDGTRVSCSVTPYHVFFCDEDLTDYDPNLKVNPPLRTKADMLFLRNALKKGEIDFIASHHQPQDWDNKVCEFESVKYGMIGLESVFGVMGICGIEVHNFIKMQTENIRKIFSLPIPKIREGSIARLTLFNPASESIFSEKDIQSKSKNTAFIGQKIKGSVIGIINRDKVFLNK